MGVPCAECGRVSAASPSDYFCSDVCQQHWHAKQTIGPAEEVAFAGPPHLAPVLRRWQAA
jgi:endogenous inhibitor of DNA gyrase (YacG/DUF329 family)